MEENDVFKPRHSIGRSPTRKRTSITLDSDNEDEDRLKRIRQDEKRKREEEEKAEYDKTRDEDTDEDEDEEELIKILKLKDNDRRRRKIIKQINTQLDQIDTATSRVSGGKLALLKSDQEMVRASIRRLENVLLHITNEWTSTLQKLETEKKHCTKTKKTNNKTKTSHRHTEQR